MKKLHFLFILLAGFIIVGCADKGPKVIEHPVYGLQNFKTVEVGKVVLTDTATILHIDAYFHPGNWIRIDSATYIQADGKKYIIEGSEGIELNTEHWMPESGEDHFTLVFPPIPKGTKKIDFIESDCDDCFKIWDIDLTGKADEYKPDLPEEVLNFKIDKDYKLPAPEFKIAKTKVTLYLTGLKEGYALNNMRLAVSNLFTQERDEATGKKESEGKYVFEVDMYSTSQAYLLFGNTRISMYLNPGEDAEVYYDLTAHSKFNSRYNPEPEFIYGGFKGDFAQLNTQFLRYPDVQQQYYINLYEDSSILDMTSQQYVEYVFKLYNEKIADIEGKDYPEALKEVAKAELKSSLVQNILSMERNYMVNYREKNNIDWDKPVEKDFPKATNNELLALKKIDFKDPLWIYSEEFGYVISYLTHIISSDQLLNEIAGTDSGIIQDIKKALPIMQKAVTLIELTPEEEKILSSTSTPYYKEVFDYIFEKSKREQEEALAKGGFVIVPTPKSTNDKLLETIIAQYKGKAVFVDFWATWCGPCLNAMKTIKPIKPEMKDKGVVSLYISNTSSPKPKWVNMLPDIGGLHYYLMEDQWKALSDKYGIRGIPTYMIFDKNGKKVFEATGYPGNNKIKEELAKVW
ncbi:MAG TPA: hypothetical protein DIT04_01140 [Dysgonomonas sp.]|nr:hypothetical protein [Dysgonomonas sp.]